MNKVDYNCGYCITLTGCVTFNGSSFIRLGVSLAFSDNTTDDSSILILSYVLPSKIKQFHLQACRYVN